MINIQDSELMQLIHEQQLPVGLKKQDKQNNIDLSLTYYFILAVGVSVIGITILGS